MDAYQIMVREPRTVTVEPYSPADPGPDEVLLQTRTTLVSPGTERAFYLALPNTSATYPLVPGYSNIADVAAVGAQVTTLKPGDRVASPARHQSHPVIAASRCVPVPTSLPDEEAVFFNLIAIAMQGVRKARIELGEPVVVLGAGLIGIFAARLAQLAGGLPVITVDLDAGRLELARLCGIDETLISDASLPDRVGALTDGAGAAVVIEATGAPPAVLSAFGLARDRGRVVLLGSTRGETDGVNFYRDIHRKGLTVIGGHEITRPLYENSPGWWTQRDEHRVALALLGRGRIATAPLLSHRFGWRDFAGAYALLETGDRTALGMMIDWTV